MLGAHVQRPKTLSIEPNSGDVLFVLNRYRGEEEEKIRGTWAIVTNVTDGVAVPGQDGVGDLSLDDGNVTSPAYMPGQRVQPFYLDPTREPKKITLLSGDLHPENMYGIYRLDGDKLHIAYRKQGPPPEKFESTSGSGVTLLVLQRLKTPAGAGGALDHNGNATANIAAKPEQNQTLVVNPAAELKALQGQWNVVRVEKGGATDRLWVKDFLTVGRQFHFVGTDLRVRNVGQNGFRMYACSVGSNSVPRWIDLHRPNDQSGGLFALGVYEIKGDQLKLCLANCESLRGTTQRPKSLAVEPLSGNVLLTLERYRPSADETDIQGHWSVATRIEDGETISSDTYRGRYAFMEYGAFFFGPKGTKGWGYLLDPRKQPKTITMQPSGYVDKKCEAARTSGDLQV